MENQDIYEMKDVVRAYSSRSDLQKPEEIILGIFKNKLKDMKMLDIGIGGGRTTYHFAPLVKEYIGVDYSRNMIEACNKRFSEFAERDSFKVCDARDMTIFQDNYFDFVLFSYNGIDCIAHEDRLKALKEIRRVSKEGGYFCFSSHNLNTSLEYTIGLTLNPIEMIFRIYYYFLFKLLTRYYKNLKRTSNYSIINDGTHRYRMMLYYIKPEEQIDQLFEIGFKDIKVYSLSGKEIGTSAFNTAIDSWLYYLCRI